MNNTDPLPSSWKSAFRRSICCDEPSPPTNSPNGAPEKHVPGLQQHNTAENAWKRQPDPSTSSSLEAWAQKSDDAAQDVFSTIRNMFTSPRAQATIMRFLPGSPQQHTFVETEKLSNRPVSEVISESDSRASVLTQRSVSDLGAEAEPQWLLAATQKEAWARGEKTLEVRHPTQQSLNDLREAKRMAELKASWAGIYLSSSERRFRPERADHVDSPVKHAAIKSTLHSRPRGQWPSQQEPRRSTSTPTVTLQAPRGQIGRRPESGTFAPAQQPQQSRLHGIHKPLPMPPVIDHGRGPPLTALIYFALELPRSSPQLNGGYLRHYTHPMRLPLSTPLQLLASIRNLRGYLTQQTDRFLSHFAAYTARTTTTTTTTTSTTSDIRLVVNFQGLFGAGGHGLERIWGPELTWAWVDASEERFAEAVVGVLRDVAEAAVRAGKGGVVDVVCVVREVVDGRRGYGLLMDVRRIGEDVRRAKRTKT